MKKADLKPIFYDNSKKRWPRVKYGLIFLLLSLVLFFGAFIVSLLVEGTANKTPKFLSYQPYHASQLEPLASANVFTSDSDEPFSPFSLNDTADVSSLIEQNLIEHHIKKMAFLPHHDVASMNSFRHNLSKLDVVLVGGAHLKSTNGDIIEKEPHTLRAIANEIHQKRPDGKAILVLDNSWLDTTSNFLSSPSSRQNVIQHEIAFLKQHHFDGIHIHFENIAWESRDDLSLFVEELSNVLHSLNYSVSINIEGKNPAYDYRTIANNVDFELLTAFNEHSTHDDTGPLASLSWFRETLSSTLREIPPEKLVLGLANYGVDWKENERIGQPLTFPQAMMLAKLTNDHIILDPQSGNPFFNYKDENNTLHTVWFLDAVTLFNQSVLVKDVRLHGVALWRLGSEDPSSWLAFNQVDYNKNTSIELEKINTKNTLSSSGDTESDVFAITQTPEMGEREIDFDEASGLIRAERYRKFPISYNIHGYSMTNRKKVALIFDDGPSPKYTPEILNILKEKGAPATFFIVGRNALKYPEIMRREIAEGHDIGNHTFSHPNIADISNLKLSMELSTTKRLLESSTGRSTVLFRAPYGVDSPPKDLEQVKRMAIISQMGYCTVRTSVDSEDWKKPGVDFMVNDVIKKVHEGDGGVIAFHDGGGMRQQTVDALPKIIDTLKKEGYEFVSISQLMNLNQDIVMPTQAFSWHLLLSKINFKLLHISSYFFPILYLLGISIVMIRLFLLTSLSIFQKVKTKYSKEMLADNDIFSLAVIVPGYNESANIVKTIQSLLSAKHPKRFEIIVVNDGSTDNTLQILRENFSNHPIVKILSQRNSGKGVALNYGLSKTTADLVTIIDADTIVCPDTLMRLMYPLHNPKVGAVAGTVKVANRGTIMSKWQILEYATGQSLDRRALSVFDAVVVVPGALGCWRRKVLLDAGGFTTDTLAEDADMTLKIKKLGYRIAVAERAYAYTEVPETVKIFLRQRFRWMYGTYQVLWKHKDAFFRLRYGSLGFIALPNLFLVHVILPLIAPLIDLGLIFTLLFFGVKAYIGHGMSLEDIHYLKSIGIYYILFTGIDLFTTFLAFLLEGKEKKLNLFWLIPQRFFYKQLIYIMAYRSSIAVLHGREVWWGRMIRKQTTEMEQCIENT